MSNILDEVLAANAEYAATYGDKTDLTIPPARRFAILTCMDARLDPAKYAGLAEGDAHVIRNAGGRASDDAIRSLVISHKLLGTQEWFVIHHTDCGMGRLATLPVQQQVAQRLGLSDDEVAAMAVVDPTATVQADIQRLREAPGTPDALVVTGLVYDGSTGMIDHVVLPAPPRAPP